MMVGAMRYLSLLLFLKYKCHDINLALLDEKY